MNLMNLQIMNKKTKFNSIHEIRLAKERLRYESLMYRERLKNKINQLCSGFSFSLRNLSFNIRNRFMTYSVFRSLFKANFFYDFIKNFARGFRQAR